MTLIAPILEQAQGKIRFRVDDVTPTQEVPLATAAKPQLEQRLGSSIFAFSHDETFQVISDKELNPLALAIHTAFSQHHPLRLTPDIIWMAIAQGFAQHITNHAEALRNHFVHHEGKNKLIVEFDGVPSSRYQWSEVIQEWGLQIRDHVGADLYRLFECNFSTSTPITRTASHVVMMEAFHQYFDYVILCSCGIPEITLLGTVEDWQSIYERVQNIAQYNLNWWTDRLLPICQEFVHTAAGKPDLEFWRCIYKPQQVYDAEYITGWLADLFPYLKDSLTQTPTIQNKLLTMDRCKLPSAKGMEERAIFTPVREGIPLKSLPLGLSQVTFKLQAATDNHQKGQKQYDLALIAGFIGVCREAEQGELHPEIGWAVQEYDNRFGKLLDKIQREHLIQQPIQWSDFEVQCSLFDLALPKEFIQMLAQFNGATLYPHSGHSWEITSITSWVKTYHLAQKLNSNYAHHFINLEDGRCIVYAFRWNAERCYFLLNNKEQENELQESIIIATSLAELFECIFEADGNYYFDDPNFTSKQT